MKNFLCKIGFHDWEDIGFQGIYWHRERITDRICLRCGKKDLRKEAHLKRYSKRYDKAKELANENKS